MRKCFWHLCGIVMILVPSLALSAGKIVWQEFYSPYLLQEARVKYIKNGQIITEEKRSQSPTIGIGGAYNLTTKEIEWNASWKRGWSIAGVYNPVIEKVEWQIGRKP